MARQVRMSDALDEYRSHLQARGLAGNTLKGQMQPLTRALAEWGNLYVSSITGQHIDKLFRVAKWGPSTRNIYLGYLRGFFTFCRREGYMSRDFEPTDGWRNVKVPNRDRLRIPLDEFPLLLDANQHPRDRMVCALGLYTFMRGGEIQTLTIGDIDLKKFTLNMYRHKTQEWDSLPICEELAEELERWFSWYRADRNTPHLKHEWMLTPAKMPNPTRYNPVTRHIEVVTDVLTSVRPERRMTHPYRSVQRALKKLGYDTYGEGEHTLRRSGSRCLFDTLRAEGYDGALMRVSSMLGHKDTRVTERYIGLSLERTQRNEHFAGKPMFARQPVAQVVQLKGVSDG